MQELRLPLRLPMEHNITSVDRHSAEFIALVKKGPSWCGRGRRARRGDAVPP